MTVLGGGGLCVTLSCRGLGSTLCSGPCPTDTPEGPPLFPEHGCGVLGTPESSGVSESEHFFKPNSEAYSYKICFFFLKNYKSCLFWPLLMTSLWGFPGGSAVQKSACNARDATAATASIAGSGRCPGEGDSNPLQYSCLENLLDR